MSIIYPTPDQVIKANEVVLNEIHVKKGDKHQLLSYSKITNAIEACKTEDGDIYDKASTLIIDLTRMPHAFASGNRRTAFAVTMEFMKANGERLPVLTDARNVLSGIREGFYTKEDVKEWLKGNGIREFHRK